MPGPSEEHPSSEDRLDDDLAHVGPLEPVVLPAVEHIIQRFSASSPALPEWLGEYRVQGELKRGGMGIIYRALDRAGQPVVVKVMKPEFAQHPKARERFLREAREAKKVRSPHVVTIHSVGEDGTPYIGMELVEGVTLAQWVWSNTVTAREVVWIARDVLTGLVAIQEHELIHRDIQPANLMVTPARVVKLIDFGLVRAVGAECGLTAGEVLGTPGFMAPEQIKNLRVDGRADLFSLGAVLYWMVARTSPFQRESVEATLHAMSSAQPTPLTGIHPKLAEFIARLLACNRGHRPGSAAAALTELQEIEAQVTTEPTPPPQPRRDWTVAGAALAGAFLAAALLWAMQWLGLGVLPNPSGRNAGTVPVAVEDHPVEGMQMKGYARTWTLKIHRDRRPWETEAFEFPPGFVGHLFVSGPGGTDFAVFALGTDGKGGVAPGPNGPFGPLALVNYGFSGDPKLVKVKDENRYVLHIPETVPNSPLSITIEGFVRAW